MARVLSLLSFGVLAGAAAVRRDTLPVIDLGYELHQAASLNTDGSVYNFSNIRYSEAPVGDLRWRAPQPPSGTAASSVINDGSVGRVCPQSSGNWSIIAQQFTTAAFSGGSFDYDTVAAALPSTPLGISFDPRTSEDCLFLDVLAPAAALTLNATAQLPVLVWIHGGGYTAGEKTGYGKFDPSRMLSLSGNGFVFVALNYRLGSFGFLYGDDSAQVTPNAGLLDQRLALQWVQDHIHLFGGDKDRVTVMGGSAGAGSIFHQMTADFQDGEPLGFQQAILQSPAFLPAPTSTIPRASTQDLLAMLGVSTVEEARQVDSQTLIETAALQIYSHAPYGSNMYGPYVDGAVWPELPGQLAAAGSIHADIQAVMVSHNTEEGYTFTDPRIATEDDYENMLRGAMPDMSAETLDTITTSVYPADFDGSEPWASEWERAKVTTQESTIICNPQYVASARRESAYALRFGVPPGTHGQETNYVFYTGSSSSVVPAVATALQQYIVSFVMGGTPVAANGTAIPVYGADSELVSLETTGLNLAHDDTDNDRCRWWQQALYA